MKKRFILLYLPCVFLLGFFVFHFISAAYWPGGNKWDRSAEGYSWISNYYCDLLRHTAHNGMPNPGRPFIMASLVCLVTSFLSFWINLVNFWFFSRKHKYLSNLFGLLVVGSFALLPVYHDPAVTSAMLLGWIGFAFLLFLFYIKKEYGSLLISILLLITASLNYIVWYTEIMLVTLPLLQRIAFLVFAVWIGFLSVKVIQYNRKPLNSMKT
jgi:hypothetical protein